MECGGLPPLSPSQNENPEDVPQSRSRSNRIISAIWSAGACSRFPQSGGKPPHSKVLTCQGRSNVVAAFGRKPLNFRIPGGLAATSELPRWATPGKRWRECGKRPANMRPFVDPTDKVELTSLFTCLASACSDEFPVVFGRPDAEVTRDAASGDGTWFGGTMCQL